MNGFLCHKEVCKGSFRIWAVTYEIGRFLLRLRKLRQSKKSGFLRRNATATVFLPSAVKLVAVCKKPFYLLLLLAGCATQKNTTSNVTPSVANLRSHIEYLSSDNLEGRRTGSAGEGLAAGYIATAFQQAGLQPKGTDGYFQPFPVWQGMAMAPATALSINGTALELNKDFFPLAYSHNGNIDASASISLLEKGEPWFFDVADLLKQTKTNPHLDLSNAVLNKANEAARKGATAFFVYNSSAQPDGLSFNGENGEHLAIPVLYLSKNVAARYLSDASAFLQIKGTVDLQPASRSGKNVVGYIDNGAPYTVVVGAHYDHLGYGEDNTSLYRGADKQIHNGADDNASGTAALLELARLVKASNLKASNYLFIAFSGEEQGLFGSKYFVQHPTVDVNKINFMLNMDMVGRLNDSTKTLTVGGYGTTPVWGQLYHQQGKDALTAVGAYRFDSTGTGPSDHTSFYQKGIPVLFYFTGVHADYHKPTDDADKINLAGEAAVVQHVFSLLQEAAKVPGKFPFTKTKEPPTAAGRFSVTLGIMPDYTFNGAGIRVDAVSEGKAAQKAGLQEGDVITALGNYPVTSMEGYMQALSQFKKGDTTTVRYTRNGKPLEATAAFQ